MTRIGKVIFLFVTLAISFSFAQATNPQTKYSYKAATSITAPQPQDNLGDCSTICRPTGATDCVSGGPCSDDEYPCYSEYEELRCEEWCYNLFFGWVMVDYWYENSFSGCCEPCVMGVGGPRAWNQEDEPTLTYADGVAACKEVILRYLAKAE